MILRLTTKNRAQYQHVTRFLIDNGFYVEGQNNWSNPKRPIFSMTASRDDDEPATAPEIPQAPAGPDP